jgi:hypothetical protein
MDVHSGIRNEERFAFLKLGAALPQYHIAIIAALLIYEFLDLLGIEAKEAIRTL